MATRGIAQAIAAFLQSGVEGYKTGRTLQDMAAERALKKKQFELDVEKAGAGTAYLDPNTNTVKQIPGISPEAQGRLLQGVSDQPRTQGTGIFGKFVVGKKDKPAETITNVTAEEFNANPEKYRNMKIKIGPSPKVIVPPEIADAKQGMDEIRKIFLRDGSISDSQAKLVKQYAQTLGSNVTTEEDKGLLAWANKLMGDTQHTMVPGAPSAKPAKTPSGTMRVKDKKTGQTGTIPASEFDPNLYDPI